MKKVSRILFGDIYSKTAFALFLIGAFLRFYRLDEFVTFLGDQGRDAIIIKRLLTLEHLPAIGAPTSVGQIYLGPFYYYFISPWLVLFRFEPIGLAVGTALMASLAILISFFIVKELFNPKAALITTVLITFSSVMIEYSRFSWNPNLLPLFSLLTFYFGLKAVKTRKVIFFILAGAFLSFSLQLHYLSLFLLPPLAIMLIRKKNLTRVVLFLVSFLFFSLPLVIFDLRHNFLNSRSFLTLLNTKGTVTASKLESFFSAFFSLNAYVFAMKINAIMSTLFLLMLIIMFIAVITKKTNLRSVMIFFIFLLAGISLYSGPKHPHYFGVIYPFYFMIIAYLASLLFDFWLGRGLLIILLVIFLSFQSRYYSFLFGRGSNQIDHAKSVSRIIMDHVSKKKYTVTALPHKYSDSIYRYFLELWGRRPLEKDSLERADELFVACDEPCRPIGDPQWDIAYFAPRQIVGQWKVSHLTLYKLTR